MGKQTMGTPCHSIMNRADNKLYRINFPQSPIVKTKLYDHFKMDDYPIGTNAIVAVVSYTGYDMEDAMVLNKSSYERGFGHGMIYSTEIVELNDKSFGSSRNSKIFGKFFNKSSLNFLIGI
jgi:DNA-directed RNA polymerase I subunit RPA2